MRKYLFLVAAAASASLAAPAFAQGMATPFTGGRVGVTIGTVGDDVIDFDTQTVGVDAGYDFDLGGAVAGIGLEYQTELGNDFFEASETSLLARIGAQVASHSLVYVNGGYSRNSSSASPFADGNDGYRLGAGVEFALGNGRTSLKIEERYFDFGDGGDSFQTAAGLSFRF